MTPAPEIRLARPTDGEALFELDPVAHTDGARRERITRGIQAGEIRVAEAQGHIVGYALLSRSFFERPFIELVVIDPGYRGEGVGPRLIRRLEADCRSLRIFTSTNASNDHMRHVLEKLGYEPSGIVHHLDPGDPEIIYSKALREEPRCPT